ncbi:MAG: hypothetical protein AAGC88_14560, partial [Bacteroidota bacterium]
MKRSFPMPLMALFILVFSILFLPEKVNSQSLMRVDATKNISLAVPSDFRPMTNDEIADRYFTNRRPVAMYTDQRNVVDLGVNESLTEWSEDDLIILKDFYKANISGFYSEVNFLKEELTDINGRKFAVFEFESTVAEEDNAFSSKPEIRKYTYIQYTIVNGKSWVFNLTVPLRHKPKWQPIAPEIMNSV